MYIVCGDIFWDCTHPLRICVTFGKSLNLSGLQPCCLEEENIPLPLCVLVICWVSLSIQQELKNHGRRSLQMLGHHAQQEGCSEMMSLFLIIKWPSSCPTLTEMT